MAVTINGSTGIAGVDGSAGTPAVQGNDSNTGVFFPAADTIAFAEGGAEVARFDSSGNFGIGTSSPAYKLDVQGGNIRNLIEASRGGLQLFAYSSAQTYDAPRIETWRARGTAASPSVVSSGDELFSLQCSGRNANSAWTYAGGIFMYATGTVTGSNVPSYISFETNSGSAGAERARIDSSGIMLIGATSARTTQAKLELRSAANTALSLYMFKDTQVEATLGFKSSTDSNFYVGSGSTSVGTNGVYLTNTGSSWNAVSDERKKTIVEPIANAAEKVASLRAVIGYYNHDENQIRRPFLIAQDVQAVLPEAVNIQDPETGTLGMSYTDTIPLLVAAIKEQQALIAALQADVAALKGAQA